MVGIIKALLYRAGEAQANKLEAKLNEGGEERAAARLAGRNKQIEALFAAAPQSPPERMRVTIQLNEIKHPNWDTQFVTHFGDAHLVQVEKGEISKWSVDMLLQLSETERGIIKAHSLELIVIEDEAAFTEEQIAAIEARNERELSAMDDPLQRAVTNSSMKASLYSIKEQRTRLRLGDYLVSPFSKSFPTEHEAMHYITKLKTKILPNIKALIDQYRDHQSTQTFEL